MMDYPEGNLSREIEEIHYEKWLKQQPKCAECGEHIQTEFRYNLGGYWYCEDCVNDAAELVEY